MTGISISFIIFIFAIFFWDIIINYFGYDITNPSIILLRTSLIQLSGTAGIFGIFHSYVTRTDFEYEVTRAITTLLGNDPNNFDHFSFSVKKQFVENSILSALRPTLGKAVFDSIVSSYFAESDKRKKNYRKNMQYGVDFFSPTQSHLDDWSEFFNEPRDFFDKTYFFAQHFLTYKKIPASPIDCVHITLGFTEKTMQNFLRRDDVFYRDLIRLEDHLIKKVTEKCKDAKSLEYFVRKILRFDIKGENFSWDDVEISLQYLSDDSNPYLEMIIKCQNKYEPQFEIRHISIQDKLTNMFLMTVPEPCDSPTLWLGSKKDMLDVLPRPLFSTVDPGAIRIERRQMEAGELDAGTERHYVRVDGWSFPLGGVVYVWRNC